MCSSSTNTYPAAAPARDHLTYLFTLPLLLYSLTGSLLPLAHWHQDKFRTFCEMWLERTTPMLHTLSVRSTQALEKIEHLNGYTLATGF